MPDYEESRAAESGDNADERRDGESDALLSRLRLIEDQPLAERAAAYSQIHDGLQSILEGGDSQQHHG